MTTLTNLPLISRLSSKVIRILGCNPGVMTLQGTNTYLVGTGTRRVLIDAGDSNTAEEYVTLLGNVLTEEKATIEHLVVTHWHSDHMGGVNSVQSLIKGINSDTTAATVWKLPRSSEDNDIITQDTFTVWQPLEDEQVIEVEGAKLVVKHTPGHTTDHACILLENEKILFSGDCILGETTAVFEDLHDYMLSLQKILEMKPKIIYPGHGKVVEHPIPTIRYYISHRMQREMQILQILKQNGYDKTMSEMDIVEKIYKEIPENLKEAAAINVEHHLQKLLKEGKVSGQKKKWQCIA